MLELLDSADAALLEENIAHGQGFIHDEGVRIHVYSNRKRQPHKHSARIRLDRTVDEFADFGEFLDGRNALASLCFGETKNGCIEKNVFTSAELGIETGAEFQES